MCCCRPPGAKYHYSSYGFSLAQVALEAAMGGKPYWQLLEEELLTPGGLNGIRVHSFLGVVPDRTSFYDKPGWIVARPAPAGATLLTSLPLNSAYKQGGGGLLASAAELARFDQLHSRPGSLLSPRAYATLMTPQSDARRMETATGLAWTGETDAFGRQALAQTGSQRGTRSLLAVYRREGYAVAVLSNLGGYPQDLVGLGAAIVDLLEGGTGRPPEDGSRP